MIRRFKLASKSMRYNPFAYLHSEKDILKLVNTIIANTKTYSGLWPMRGRTKMSLSGA